MLLTRSSLVLCHRALAYMALEFFISPFHHRKNPVALQTFAFRTQWILMKFSGSAKSTARQQLLLLLPAATPLHSVHKWYLCQVDVTVSSHPCNYGRTFSGGNGTIFSTRSHPTTRKFFASKIACGTVAYAVASCWDESLAPRKWVLSCESASPVGQLSAQFS